LVFLLSERQGRGLKCELPPLHSNTKEPVFSHTGSGEESARASAFFFEKIGGYKLRKNKIHVSIVVRVSFNAHTYTIILWKANKRKLGIK